MDPRRMRTPFVSSSSATVTYTPGSNSGDLQIPLDASKTTNTSRFPVEVNEIRISLRVGHTVVSPGPGGERSAAVAPLVYLRAKLGKYAMTDGSVPVALFAPYRFLTALSAGGGNDWDDQFSTGVGTADTIISRRMILSPAITLVPGMGFAFAASIPAEPILSILTSAISVDVTITIVGRYLPFGGMVERLNAVPMISHTMLRQAKRISLEDEFRNPLAQALTVTRIVGAQPHVTPTQMENSSRATITPITITFPDSTKSSEDPISFDSLIGQMRVWPMTYTMPPNARLMARIERNASEDDSGDDRVAYQVALYGTRPEPLR